LRTFIQRRITHKLNRQEETAQKSSCMYLYSFYFNFSDRKWVKIAEMPALTTCIMKNPSAPKVLTIFCILIRMKFYKLHLH
jgi:hypothetical protein